MNIPVLSLISVFVAGWGAITDLRSHKIYNYLTMPSIILGLLMNLLFAGFHGLAESFLGILLGICCMLFWMVGMLKAGDIKLYMAVGALGGWRFCICTVIFSILIGGIVALVLMLLRKSGRASLKRIWLYLLNLWYTKQFHPYRPEEKSAYFSFGCCIFAGALAALVYLYG